MSLYKVGKGRRGKKKEQEQKIQSYVLNAETAETQCHIHFEFQMAYHKPLDSKRLVSECIISAVNDVFTSVQTTNQLALSLTNNDIVILEFLLKPNESNPRQIKVRGFIKCKDEHRKQYLDALQLARNSRKIAKELAEEAHINALKIKLLHFQTKYSIAHHVNQSFIDGKIKDYDRIQRKYSLTSDYQFPEPYLQNDMIGSDSDSDDHENKDDVKGDLDQDLSHLSAAFALADEAKENEKEGATKQELETLLSSAPSSEVSMEYDEKNEEQEMELEGQMVGMTLMGGVNVTEAGDDDEYAKFRKWLNGLGLEKYLEKFMVNGYDIAATLKDIADDKDDYDKLMVGLQTLQSAERMIENEDNIDDGMGFVKGKGMTMMGMANDKRFNIDGSIESVDVNARDEIENPKEKLIKGVSLMTQNGSDMDNEDNNGLIQNDGTITLMGQPSHADNELDLEDDDKIINKGGMTIMGFCAENEKLNE